MGNAFSEYMVLDLGDLGSDARKRSSTIIVQDANVPSRVLASNAQIRPSSGLELEEIVCVRLYVKYSSSDKFSFNGKHIIEANTTEDLLTYPRPQNFDISTGKSTTSGSELGFSVAYKRRSDIGLVEIEFPTGKQLSDLNTFTFSSARNDNLLKHWKIEVWATFKGNPPHDVAGSAATILVTSSCPITGYCPTPGDFDFNATSAIMLSLLLLCLVSLLRFVIKK